MNYEYLFIHFAVSHVTFFLVLPVEAFTEFIGLDYCSFYRAMHLVQSAVLLS